MKFIKTETQYLVRLEKGEKLVSTITEFAKKENIKTGEIQGIGAVKDALISYYLPAKKSYIEKKMNGDYEILSLLGSFALNDGKSIPHLHISLSDENFNAFGGHLIECHITGTVEIYITPSDITVNRKHDDETNLMIWDI